MKDDSIFRESAEWLHYRKGLSKFIASPASAMVMDADVEWRLRNEGKSGGRSAFKLLNGQVVKKFVTIWELFDHRREFDQCIEMLTEKALEIRARVRFSRIVTAATTARELADSLFARLQEREFDPDLSVVHFGADWTAGMLKDPSASLKDQAVLVLADVVNSGYLIKAMSEMVAKNGGAVKSVLCVVITKPEWIRCQQKEGVPHRFDSENLKARLHSLAEFPIEPLNPDEYDEAKIIPIDYNALLPVRRNVSSNHYAPAFPVAKTFQHLEAAEAIDFGSFESDDHRFSCAVALPRLLERYNEEIWSRIGGRIVGAACRAKEEAGSGNHSAGDLLLVTTYKREDLTFKNYIEDRLKEEGYKTTCAITLKRGVTDTPYLHLSLGAKGMDVRGKEVVLAMATLSTHEKLRSIVSLLVEGEVRKIIVICLLNSMGPFTTSFIQAIERFIKRVRVKVGSANGSSFTEFDFSMVYSFLDLRGADLAAVPAELNWLFSRFRSRTRVASFVRVSQRIESYFAPTSFIRRAYQRSSYSPLSRPYTLNTAHDPVTVSTHEGKIALMTYHFALDRSFVPISEELVSTTDRRTFIHLYRLMLTDIHHLRFTGELARLRGEMYKRLGAIQEEMFALEAKASDRISGEEMERLKDEIGGLVNVQVYLIFGLGVIAHYDGYDQTSEREKWITDLLLCRKTPEEWIDRYPICLDEYFGEERVFFAVAFILHGLHPEFHRKRTATHVKEALNEALTKFKARFKDRVETTEKQEPGKKARGRLIMNNLDLLLTETGKHDELEKHQVIRYLHREVLRPKEGHNPIFTTLSRLLRSMAEVVEGQSPKDEQKPFDLGKELLTRLDEALSATSSLNMICQATRQLFFFTPTLPEYQERYTASIEQDGFAGDCDELIRLLNDVRQRRNFSVADSNRIRRIDTKLRGDFFDPSSHLRLTLRSYVVRLDEILEQALSNANDELNKVGFDNLLKPHLDEIRLGRQQGRCDWPVLCDRHLLRETLRNLLTNLRHSFPEGARHDLKSHQAQIEVKCERFVPRPEMNEKTGFVFWLRVKGKPPEETDFLTPENTISDQLLRVQALGGDWEFVRDKDGLGYSFGLKSLTRFAFESWSQSNSEGADKLRREERRLDDRV